MIPLANRDFVIPGKVTGGFAAAYFFFPISDSGNGVDSVLFFRNHCLVLLDLLPNVILMSGTIS